MITILVESSVLILIICLFRVLFGRRVRATSMYALWLLVIARLLPFISRFIEVILPNLDLSVMRATNAGGDLIYEQVVTYSESTGIVTDFPAQFDLRAISIPWYLGLIWFVGAFVLFLWMEYVNEKFRRRLYNERITIDVEGCPYSVYQVPGLESPCVFRVLREKGIYLTDNIIPGTKDFECVLAHEICHLKHHDLLWAKIRCIIIACFWVNPFIWLAASMSKKDCEMACDERAVKMLGECFRFNYSEALVDALKYTNDKWNLLYITSTMSSGVQVTKKRLVKILHVHQNGFVSFILSFCLISIVILSCFISNADVRKLSAEGTIQQYFYYQNKGYSDGMRQLGYNKELGPWSADGLFLGYDFGSTKVTVKNCVDVTGNKEYDKKDIKCVEKKVFKLNVIERYTNKVIEEHDPRELVIAITLIKQEADSDWKIFWDYNYLDGFYDEP